MSPKRGQLSASSRPGTVLVDEDRPWTAAGRRRRGSNHAPRRQRPGAPGARRWSCRVAEDLACSAVPTPAHRYPPTNCANNLDRGPGSASHRCGTIIVAAPLIAETTEANRRSCAAAHATLLVVTRGRHARPGHRPPMAWQRQTRLSWGQCSSTGRTARNGRQPPVIILPDVAPDERQFAGSLRLSDLPTCHALQEFDFENEDYLGLESERRSRASRRTPMTVRFCAGMVFEVRQRPPRVVRLWLMIRRRSDAGL